MHSGAELQSPRRFSERLVPRSEALPTPAASPASSAGSSPGFAAPTHHPPINRPGLFGLCTHTHHHSSRHSHHICHSLLCDHGRGCGLQLFGALSQPETQRFAFSLAQSLDEEYKVKVMLASANLYFIRLGIHVDVIRLGMSRNLRDKLMVFETTRGGLRLQMRTIVLEKTSPHDAE